ncbi:MAG TPA: hypothetical protein VNN20_00560 [Thermodesulfobacteriota bacterium]|nr:hypothetical protein [Thermodesulfobacteriota bacterium]
MKHIIIMLAFAMYLTGSNQTLAQEVYTVKQTRGQVEVEKTKPNEFTALLLSEGRTGGVIVTPEEGPSFGHISSIYAKEKKELPSLGYPSPGKIPSGIELRVVFESNIYDLPSDAWITFNIYQWGAAGMCPYHKGSLICSCNKTYSGDRCI